MPQGIFSFIYYVFMNFDFTGIIHAGRAAELSAGSVADTAGLITQGFSIDFTINLVSFFVFITLP